MIDPADSRQSPQANTVPDVEDLLRGSAAVEQLIAGTRPDQWSAPTPCEQWTVRQLVAHLVGMDRVFTALLRDAVPPRPAADAPLPDSDQLEAFRGSAASLATEFARPGVLERTYCSPMGSATGAERLQIRLYDLLAHGWDLARATSQPAAIPEDLAERALTFVRSQLSDASRPGRFAPPQPVSPEAPAIDRLAAFLGRSVDNWPASGPVDR